MIRFSILSSCLLSLAALAATSSHAQANLSATQIVDKNVAARGGQSAWHAVQSLTLEGTMDAGGKEDHTLPFVMKMKRPHKSRLEIVFKDQTALQVFDGTHGWKVRPFLNRNEVETFTPTETKIATATDELDGPLVDYAAKGTKVALLGKEAVEGHPAYKLELTMRNGQKRKVWIDAGTFLELKADGEPRILDGKPHAVSIFYRDYKAEHGLMIPHVLETVVAGVKQTHKIEVSKVAVNESLNDTLFDKPRLTATAAAVTVPKQP